MLPLSSFPGTPSFQPDWNISLLTWSGRTVGGREGDPVLSVLSRHLFVVGEGNYIRNQNLDDVTFECYLSG